MPRPRVDMLDQFWAGISIGDDCWDWTGSRFPNGYGYIRVPKPDRQMLGISVRGAHRFAYELLRGVIPVGLTVDHLCRNRACVRPLHMEAVPQAENNRRATPFRKAKSFAGRRLRRAPKAHCPRGHAYTGIRVRNPSGRTYQVCGTCKAAQQRAYIERRRAA